MAPFQAIPRIAWLAGLIVVVPHVIVTLLDAFGVFREEFELGGLPLIALAVGLWTALAIVAVANPRTRRFGWLVVLSAWFQSWILAAIPGDVTWSLSWATWSAAYGPITHLLVAYPIGRLQGATDRALVVAGYAFWVLSPAIRMLFWDPHVEFGCDPALVACLDNVFQIRPDMDLVAVLDWIRIALTLALGGWVLLAVRRHERAATPAVRRAYVPVLFAVGVQYGLTVTDLVGVELGVAEVAAVLGSPAGSLLWDLVPAGLIAGLLAIRLSRERVATLALALAAGVPTGGLRALLARALQDPTVELAFPDATGDGFVDVDGRSVTLPRPDDPARAVARLERDGRVLALLVHDPAIDEGDPELVDAVGSVARMALVNERLTAQVRAQLEEVRASRERVVQATDAERARIERELHEGAQRRLEDLTLRLEASEASNAAAAELIARTRDELRTAIAEVRNLAQGLYPPILTASGLRAAVEALAERGPVPVALDIPDRRYLPSVEATAYFVVAEALTNVARYAAATGVRVRVEELAGRLIVSVTDDGRGGADPAHGSGLRGLLDRVAAAGGSLVVDSPPGAGTSLTATLPV